MLKSEHNNSTSSLTESHIPQSSLLLVGFSAEEGEALGAEVSPDLSEAKNKITHTTYSVVVFTADNCSHVHITDFLEHLNLESPDTRRIVISSQENFELLKLIVNYGNLNAVLPNHDKEALQTAIHAAFEDHAREIQERELLNMVHARNEQLTSLSQELEERVRKRQESLERSRTRLLHTNEKIQALHKALIAIHKANSIGELETLLNESLKSALGLFWTRIIFNSQSQLAERLEASPAHSLFKAPIMWGRQKRGQLIFARKKKFLKDDVDFLNQVTEAVALAIDRLTKLEQSEQLKQQWESTFDAISEPICLTDDKFTILRTNRAFSRITQKTFDELIGSDCFESFFGPGETPQLPKSGTSAFEIRHEHNASGRRRVYEVFAQRVETQDDEPPIHLLLFRDVTEQEKLERQILESAKMAELGTISSSIAHEINNPLGGMISFLQLIKMDLPKDDPISDDIYEMESAAQRCKEIVENLLGFSRMEDSSDTIELDLRDVIKQSLKITELQTRSKGIAVQLDLPQSPVMYSGHFNMLSQAIRNILQNANDAISHQLSENPRFEGKIKIAMKVRGDKQIIEITDNGPGIEARFQSRIFNPLFTTKNPKAHTGLGLTTAYKYIKQNRGSLEIYSQPKAGTTARITF